MPTTNVLRANAIVHSESSNELFCSICSPDPRARSKNWKSHIKSDSHVVALEKFHETFENVDDRARCKICATEIIWDMVTTHGKQHMIPPWYEPDDRDRLFFMNHILKIDTKYHCNLCDEIHRDWSAAYVHIGDSKHQSVVQNICQSMPTEGSKKFYRDLINAGFVPEVNRTVECRVCDKKNLGYHETKLHAQDPRHSKNKNKFVAKLLDRARKENLVKLAAKSSESEATASIPTELLDHGEIPLAKNFTAPIGRGMICNFFLEPTESEGIPEESNSLMNDGREEMPEEAHSPNRSEEASDTFKDFINDYVVSGSNPLCKEAKAKTFKSKSSKISISASNHSDPYCLICHFDIPGYSSVMDHVKSIPHANSLARYRCEDIIHVGDGPYYYCSSCDCTVEGFENIYRHVIDDSHRKSINPLRSDLEDKKLVRMLLKPSENMTSRTDIRREANNSVSSNENFMYIVRRNAKKSFCKICDLSEYPVDSKNVKEHVASDRHKSALIRYGCDSIVAVANIYHCRCCECDLADLENVYLHIKDKRHMSSTIKVTCKEEPRAVGRARDKFDTQFCPEDSLSQQPCGTLLSDYIFNKDRLCSLNNVNEPAKDPRSQGCKVQRPFWKNICTKKRVPRRSVLAASKIECNETRLSMASKLSCLLEFSAMNPTKNMSRFDEWSREQLNLTKFKKIRCDLCELSFYDSTKLHVHMASHFVNEFARSSKNCCTNDAMENDLNKDRNAQNSTESPQIGSQFVANGNVFSNDADDATINFSPNSDDSTNSNVQFESPNNDDPFQDTETRFSAALRETSKKNDEPAKQFKRLNRTDLKKVIELLDFDEDYIFEMEDKMTDIERGTMLSLMTDSNKVYCLVCQETVENNLNNYLKHLSSVNHCENLEMMEQDCELFEEVEDQFSDMDLAHEYMQEISDEVVQCLICDLEVENDDPKIEGHIYEEIHLKKCEETRERAMRIFEELKPRIQCNWYSVHQYWCVTCSFTITSEVDFMKHLKSRKHKICPRRSENKRKKMIFDFCAPCGILWWGYRCTYDYHSDTETHKWFARDGYYVRLDLPILAKNLLTAPEEFVENKIKDLDENSKSERDKEETLIKDIESAVKMRFPRAKAYVFGSRVSGLGTPDSDIDVYLDCCNNYDGSDMPQSQMVFSMTGVRQCLLNDEQKWDVEELLTNCRSPIIRAYHRATGLYCDISFKNGLSVENTKLIKTFNNVFPMCRKLILILKQWLAYCDLSGAKGISNYALYWYVIFYLQKESILPSIATLTSMSKKSRIIAGWEVSISQDFTYNNPEALYSIKEFLTRFFKFYANFDFRHNVASPLLGKELKKRDFAEPSKLPKEMSLYVDYIQNPMKKPEPFRIDSVMCIQDPIDLQHNLTKAVSKVYLNRFRTYCSKSLDILCST